MGTIQNLEPLKIFWDIWLRLLQKTAVYFFNLSLAVQDCQLVVLER